MKLSLILAPLIAAKVPHEVLMETVLAFETQQDDALEKRRANDRERQARKRSSRDVTGSHTVSRSRARAEDSSSNSKTTEEKKDTSPPARSRGTRIPDDFAPDIEAAISEGLQRVEAEREARNFIDYWRARPGKEALKLDWPATWRLWFRKRLTPTATAPPKPRNAGEAARQGLQRLGQYPDASDSPTRHLDTSDREPGFASSGIARRIAIASSR